jgi:hypothetical protein
MTDLGSEPLDQDMERNTSALVKWIHHKQRTPVPTKVRREAFRKANGPPNYRPEEKVSLGYQRG